ncbi:hypothetical protein PIB30_080069 [Stylosanthes scabra]|uniref:Uncharacterized protein n=1 Tax=Stylosanthes scabra TaxID=79078 RepID=A0ABU6XRR8_9FABA|nr:hypothetical protein [Stylosanthes scabra]
MKDVDEVEKQHHLYLMVVEIQLGKIWMLDTFPTDEAAIPRKYAVKFVFSDVNLLGRRPPLGDWNPEFALGILNVGNCRKDKLWVLLWLQMEQFFSLNPPGKKKNNIEDLSTKIRLDTALHLANDPFNMMEDEFMQRVAVDWTTRGAAAFI